MRQTCVQGTGCATPVIADDDTIELNQGYLNYQGLANTNFRLGRQRIKLDNDRFIGNAGFRQNEQTFDAALVSHAPLPGLDLTYAFVDHVNRVFGDDARLGDFDSNTHLFNATHDGFGWGRITLYDYLIEVDDDAPAFSSNSTGLRLDGDHTFRFNRDLTALYEAEFAYQTDHSDNPGDYGLTYYQIGPGVRIRDLTVRLGYEVLGGNGTNAFQTPFTSVHKFNGATDRFATIPVDGLRDSSVSLAYVVPMDRYLGDLRLSAAAHDFRAEDNGTRYGTEWSLKLTKFFDLSHIVNASVRAVFDLEYASYDADAFSSDTDKFWATLQLRYN